MCNFSITPIIQTLTYKQKPNTEVSYRKKTTHEKTTQ